MVLEYPRKHTGSYTQPGQLISSWFVTYTCKMCGKRWVRIHFFFLSRMVIFNAQHLRIFEEKTEGDKYKKTYTATWREEKRYYMNL